MKIHELKKNILTKTRKRVGRGISAGGGMTAGRGTKGQRSCSGFNLPRKFEGGQTPLIMRLHKMPGFKSHKKKASVISFDDISNNFKNGDKISFEALIEKGLIKKNDRAKVLSTGELKVKVVLDGVSASKPAQAAIEKFAEKPTKATREKTEKEKKSK